MFNPSSSASNDPFQPQNPGVKLIAIQPAFAHTNGDPAIASWAKPSERPVCSNDALEQFNRGEKQAQLKQRLHTLQKEHRQTLDKANRIAVNAETLQSTVVELKNKQVSIRDEGRRGRKQLVEQLRTHLAQNRNNQDTAIAEEKMHTIKHITHQVWNNAVGQLHDNVQREILSQVQHALAQSTETMRDGLRNAMEQVAELTAKSTERALSRNRPVQNTTRDDAEQHAAEMESRLEEDAELSHSQGTGFEESSHDSDIGSDHQPQHNIERNATQSVHTVSSLRESIFVPVQVQVQPKSEYNEHQVDDDDEISSDSQTHKSNRSDVDEDHLRISPVRGLGEETTQEDTQKAVQQPPVRGSITTRSMHSSAPTRHSVFVPIQAHVEPQSNRPAGSANNTTRKNRTRSQASLVNDGPASRLRSRTRSEK